MTEAKHPEALRLAEILEGDYCPDWFYEQGVDEVAAELRRQHARIAELEQEVAHTDSLLGKANALARIRAHRIAELEARVQELGAMARENRSRRIVELEAQPDAQTLCQSIVDLGLTDELELAPSLKRGAPAPHPAPVAQGDALTDTYVQQVPDKCDRIVWRGRYYHLPIDAAEHSYTEPSPMAKVAAALRQKAEQEDAAYQARRSDQGLMESEWGPMEDAPPHEDPPMHVAVVEGDDTVRTLQWNRDVAAFAYPAGTLLYAAAPRPRKAVCDGM